jgi:hypothetical protein
MCIYRPHSFCSLATGPQTLPMRVLHRVRSSASSFNSQHHLFSLRSSNSCLRLLPRLTVTSIRTSISSSITCYIRQFLRKMWPIELAFLIFIVCRIFLSSSILCNTSSFLTRSVQLIVFILSQTYSEVFKKHYNPTPRPPFQFEGKE